MQELRILIADDHFVVRQGLKQILSEHFKAARFGEASNGHDALELVWKEDWDVVLLDINMPGRGGLDALKEIKQARPKTAVIVMSMLSEDQFAVRVLKLGACAYIRKDSAEAELVAAVNAARLGQPYITPGLASKLALHIQDQRGKLPHEALTDREYQVFCRIGSGATVKEVGVELSLSMKTVSTYRVRALKKLGMRNNSQIVHYVVLHQLGTDDQYFVPSTPAGRPPTGRQSSAA